MRSSVSGAKGTMDPHKIMFGGGATGTIIHPLVLVAMLIAMALIFALPRKYVIAPLVIATFLIPLGQVFYVGGLHLFVFRLLTLAAFTRAIISNISRQKSIYSGGWNPLDTAFTSYIVITSLATIVRFPDVSAINNQIGFLWDYLLGYSVLRSLIESKKDAILVVRCFTWLMMILGAAMVFEQEKMINLFGLLGGVAPVPEMREGKVRAQGVFQHALTAGTFAATSIPLFLLLWKQGKSKVLAVAGAAAATLMTIMTQTSTSLLTYAAALFAISMWPLRKKMRTIRIGLVVALVGLALVMKAPIWFLIARIDLTGSSSSYHRAELIDQLVRHFSEWWLVGTNAAATWGWDMWDAQNMYVSVGEAGGLAALIFYIAVISRAFSRLGKARKKATTLKDEWLVWLLGAALFANVVAFFGVNYFDQSRMAWFGLISMICACTRPMLSRKGAATAPKVLFKLQLDHLSTDDLAADGLEREVEEVEDARHASPRWRSN
jgi:hypothetical protein